MNGTTILDISPSTHLTPSELERFAYIQGNGLLAGYAAQANDLEGQGPGEQAVISG